jgi:probable phosphoglycerate mutase
MVVNQLNGIFTPKNPDVLPIYADIKKMLESFESVSFTHVPRSQNTVADREANLAIDRILKK